ncbi:hypothetical protein CONCODRAFT_1800 [Conidiobolus coronatus NRRL 28638]|uniref:Pentacotripeptide-repeat region of PRORP domain-containing protein n=1 Tax=Conidiobolus coronatus (strain ATCC 28846 / CBS 209.66 / NRRL 28638) TaxID=796925 RepID=A0A137PJ63_CONC2|nr:hypothetical protein CONCODRAFT_1800 [Conidiobolus coronatus NRRL 28638]|eukprot:KXN75010.1 hypothetical protein CONCODRAFT_1800 [Conidiobolus coronatus NRRL 28638]
MSNFYHLMNQYSPQSTKLSSRLKLTQLFLNYFESTKDIEGLTKIYNNLEELDKLINNTTTRTNNINLMTRLIGLDNQLSLQILNQSWYSYNYRKSTLQNPLDFIVQYCLQTTSSTLKLTKQERISRLEILFPLYDTVEEFIKLRPNTLSRYNVEIQKILVGMGHYLGLSNNIDGLINFLNTKRLVQPNHYVYSTLIHNTMKLGFPPIAAKIFNQFMDTRLNTPPTASNNAPYASLIHGFAANKQWDALANYFDLRLNLPLKLSAKLYDDIIFSFKENTPPLQLIQTVYYQMLKVDNLRPSIGSLDVIVKLLSSYQLDGHQNQTLINPLSLRLNNYYNLVTSSNLDLDTRFFNTMIHQLVTNTTTQDLESITQLLSNLYKDLIEKDLQPNVQFLTTMLIVYLKLGRKEGVMEILGFLNSKPELMDKKLVYLLKKLI